MQSLVRLIFKLIGWEIDKTSPEGLDKCVIVMGPHTSNWDFVLGKMAFISYGVKAKYLIKKAAFFFPFGGNYSMNLMSYFLYLLPKAQGPTTQIGRKGSIILLWQQMFQYVLPMLIIKTRKEDFTVRYNLLGTLRKIF